jgi:hypothetical protein
MIGRRAVVAVVAMVVLAGCAGAGDATLGGEPVVGAYPTLTSGYGLRLPVEDYLPTAEQSARVGRAHIELVRRCLARFGIDYALRFVPGDRYGPRSLTERRYGITDLDLARDHGYGLGARDPVRQPRPAQPDLGTDGETALSGQGRTVVRGRAVPPGGCLAEAGRGLHPGTVRADIARAHRLQYTSYELSRRDSRVRAVIAAWSSCMARSGYWYADPLAAGADPAFVGRPSREEIAVATADIGCKARANLVGVWFTVESAYQRRSIDADRGGFAATRAAIAARDRIASAIVGEPGTPGPGAGKISLIGQGRSAR